MSVFIDNTLLTLADPVALAALLVPAADTTKARIRGLISTVHDFSFGRLHDVQNVTVTAIERGRPLFPVSRTRGRWLQTIPGHVNTDVLYEETDVRDPVWIDLNAHVSLSLVLEWDPGALESVLTKHIENVTSLADFQSRFRFLDLAAFLQAHDITTVEELREAYQYLLTEVKLKPLAPFNPADPANRHAVTLEVAIMIRDALSVADLLREVKLLRARADRALAFPRGVNASDVLAPLAPLVVLPASVLTAALTETKVQAFFAPEQISVAFQP